jgi:hypothetical protein
MNVKVGACLSLLGALLVLGGAASAQFHVDITVDENGNGHFTNTAGFDSSLPSGLRADPGPGGLASALTYDLLNPPGLVAGDLVLLEPSGGGLISDVVRFNTTSPFGAGAGSLVFYSDNLDGVDALADTGFPGATYTNVFTTTEVGPEGNNGFVYTPTAGQPGFVAGAAGPVIYHITSDTPAATPEFGSVFSLGGLLAASGAGVWMKRRRRGKDTTSVK